MSSYNKIQYLGGHPEMTKPGNVNIDISKGNKTIKISGGGIFSFKEILIPAAKINNVSFDEKSKRSAGKAAAGAVIGGVLTGGIGLLAGAILGGKRRDDSNLYITISHDQREFDIILKGGKDTQKLYAELLISAGNS